MFFIPFALFFENPDVPGEFINFKNKLRSTSKSPLYKRYKVTTASSSVFSTLDRAVVSSQFLNELIT
jgi:hypothetical protein